MRKVTIKEVAQEAGVSIATVSNVFNNADVLNPKTKEHVLSVAERLNYIPNQNGHNLRSKKSNAIGLFVSSMRGTYYGVLADSLHYECQKYGYELYIYIIRENTTILNNVAGQRVDGAIILYDGMSDATISKLSQSGSPIVFLDRDIKEKTISSVPFDSFSTGKMAGKYLLSLGHRNIMHIAGFDINYDSNQRYYGFLQAMEEAGALFPKENLLMGHFEREASYKEVKRYLHEGHKPPDAAFASNDLSAIGCIEAFREEGLRVPEDISVIGCDDIETCELFDPQITTVHTNFELQGVYAIRQLMRMLIDKKDGEINKISGKLIIRKSCAINNKY